MNDTERAELVDNDEGLYCMCNAWTRRNKGGVRGFVRAHRDLIDGNTEGVNSGQRRSHSLLYGP